MLTFAAAIDQQRDYYTNGGDSKGSYLVIQAARDTGTVQYKYRMQLTCSLVMKVLCLTSTIYCIAKSCNSQKYRVTEQVVCTCGI